MNTIELSGVSKSFGKVQAIEEITFSVRQGEIFGLLGPNGAGKTTTIRCILDIFKPDRGTIDVLGGPMNEAKKDRIGYLPEERGLYQEAPLERTLLYLAALKNVPRAEARRRLQGYLERFDLADHRRKKVKELSKGMQQKAQLIATLLHQPELLIIDEPFSGLDPVNVQMVKDLLHEQRAAGVTILLSAHQLNLVEELADRIVLINGGRVIIYDTVEEARRRYADNAVLVKSPAPLPPLTGVQRVENVKAGSKLHLQPGVQPEDVLQQLVAQGIPIERFELALPTLEEVFIRAVSSPVPEKAA